MSETVLHVPVDEKVEQRAQEAFAAMGLTLAQAVRAFLEQAADNGTPFRTDVPNATTRAAMERTRERVLARAEARTVSKVEDASAGD